MNFRKKFLFIIVVFVLPLSAAAQNEISKTWVADLGNGYYKNPVLHADYSDPDVCCVGNDYYMTASSFNCIPGLPILHSNDLVNWKIIGHAIEKLEPDSIFSRPQHGNGVWAPSIRCHNGEFYIYYGDPDYGIFMVKTKDISARWELPVLVKKGKGLIDPCPLWDDDGKVYLVHAYAGSRAGIKSVIAVQEMNAEGTSVIGQSRIIYDGHKLDPTIEGPKFYKRNGFYYILAPAGGVSMGWQIALRSQNIFGPYERKMIMSQGNTPINGPHQGAWVNTAEGENWFIHFQDKGAFGRVVHLQPMSWKNDWPIIGIDKDGNGCGEPVLTFKKPKTDKNYPIATPQESDEFKNNVLGLQWQWHANPSDWWYFANSGEGILSLFSVPLPNDYVNLWNVPNLLLEKFSSDHFTATAKVAFHPLPSLVGEKAGFVIMGMDYASLQIEKSNMGLMLSQIECLQADHKGKETVNESIPVNDSTFYLRIKVSSDASCIFSYSLEGKSFKTFGKPFKAREGKWIGAKMGFYCTRPVNNNDGGKIDIDWFRVE